MKMRREVYETPYIEMYVMSVERGFADSMKTEEMTDEQGSWGD